MSLFLRIGSLACLPFQPSSVSFEVKCYNKDIGQYPISKLLCPKEQVFLPGKRWGMQMNSTKGLSVFPVFCRYKSAAFSSHVKTPFPWIKNTHNVMVLFIHSLPMCTLRIQHVGHCCFVNVIPPRSGSEGRSGRGACTPNGPCKDNVCSSQSGVLMTH